MWLIKAFVLPRTPGAHRARVGVSSTFAAGRRDDRVSLQRPLGGTGSSPTLYVSVNSSGEAPEEAHRPGRQPEVRSRCEHAAPRWTHGVPTAVPRVEPRGRRPSPRAPRIPNRGDTTKVVASAASPRVHHGRSGSSSAAPRLARERPRRAALRTATCEPSGRCSDSRSIRRSATSHTIFVLWQGRVRNIISPSHCLRINISTHPRAPELLAGPSTVSKSRAQRLGGGGSSDSVERPP